MTDLKKIDVSHQLGAKPDLQLQRLAESVNMLQGVTDQNQRAVRMFEFTQRLDEIEARLKAAGI